MTVNIKSPTVKKKIVQEPRFLTGMKEIRKQMELPKHKLSKEDVSIRYPYALAIALFLTQTGGTMNDKTKMWFADFCRGIELPDEHHARIISEAMSAEPIILHKILPSISGPDISKIFLNDLKLAIPATGRKVSTITSAFIREFQKLIKLHSAESAPILTVKTSPKKTIPKKQSTTSKPRTRK